MGDTGMHWHTGNRRRGCPTGVTVVTPRAGARRGVLLCFIRTDAEGT
jgi:hypothetical protein